MIVLEKTSQLNVLSRPNTGLVVDPMDITFEDLTRDTVMIRVKVRNEGEDWSDPAFVRLESAPFGAFVPWRPLTVLPVPALAPGQSRELRVVANRPHPTPLGDFDRVPPMTVLKVLNAAPDEPTPQPGTRVAGLLDLLRRQRASRPANKTPLARGFMLPPDLWGWFGREQPHWAGNINVFVGSRAVERHVAKALRIYSGRTNLAMFVVGGPGQRDAYSFGLEGLAPDWKAALYDTAGAKTLVVGSADNRIHEGKWVEPAGGLMLIMLAVRPPVVCETGKLQVHVTRRSCRKTARVEFDLDPTAQGVGCYVA